MMELQQQVMAITLYEAGSAFPCRPRQLGSYTHHWSDCCCGIPSLRRLVRDIRLLAADAVQGSRLTPRWYGRRLRPDWGMDRRWM
jgi:hypothetical protein